MCFLELFLSTYLALVPIDSLEEEVSRDIYDGVSACLALGIMCLTVPILLHMTYIIVTYG